MAETRKLAILLFDRITALDAVGPYEVLSRLPEIETCFVAKEKGPIRTDNRSLGLIADYTLDEVPDPYILLIPGGFGVAEVMNDEATLDWIRKAHETSKWTTSVCTGSLILAATGLLKGLKATGHWATLELFEGYGVEACKKRIVREGKIVTAAGVSAGIDMGLELAALEAGDEVAQTIQLSIEYDPQPPFDCGSPEKAPKAMVDYILEKTNPRYPSLAAKRP